MTKPKLKEYIVIYEMLHKDIPQTKTVKATTINNAWQEFKRTVVFYAKGYIKMRLPPIMENQNEKAIYQKVETIKGIEKPLLMTVWICEKPTENKGENENNA